MKKLLTLALAAMTFLASCGDNDTQQQPDNGSEVPKPLSDENLLTAFALNLTQNGSPVKHTGTINQSTRRISIVVPGTGWIDNITAAVAEFTTTGKTVKVNKTDQTSGTTTNDFMREVVYTVVAESGKERMYTVDVSAPQCDGLPVVRIDTQGGAAINSKETYVTSTFTIVDPSDPTNNISAAPAGVRGRGNSTWGYPKKPYRVKLDKKASVFGLTAAKNWVLLANWQDPTLMMNTVAFEVSRRLGLGFTPTTTHVELFLNGAYQGAYTVCEHIQVNTGRVDIDEFADVFLEIDTYYDEPYKFRSAMLSLPVMFKSPEFEGAGDAEREVFMAQTQADFDAMEEAVMTGGDWRSMMDTRSFIDFVIVNEFVRNIELGHPKSTYLYKRAGGKWTWGPVWDLDWAYGYHGYGQEYWRNGSGSEMLYITGAGFDDAGVSRDEPGVRFFTRLFGQADFKAEFKTRWAAVKPLIADIDVFAGDLGSRLAESDGFNKKVWPVQYTKNYNAEVDRMRAWLKQRVAAMDASISDM